MLWGKNEVRLRWIRTQHIDPHDTARFAEILNDEEKKKAERFQRLEDRQAYILGHVLVRMSLTEATGSRSPSDWNFCVSEHGRPEPDIQSDESQVRFSLSHTRGAVAVALTTDHNIGVDVESVESRACLSDVWSVLSPDEQRYLNSLPAKEAAIAFYKIWTVKEAYLKAVGEGLSRPLDSFAVSLRPISVTETDGTQAVDWFFRQICLDDAHVVALAVQHPAPQCIRCETEPIDACHLHRVLSPGMSG